MDNHFQQELLGQITELIKDEATIETIVGKQFELGQFTCVPVMRIGMGLGAGGGESTDKSKGPGAGGGAGGGFGVEPMGFLVTKEDQISFIPTHHSKGISAAFEQMPGLLNKYLDTKKTEDVA